MQHCYFSLTLETAVVANANFMAERDGNHERNKPRLLTKPGLAGLYQ